MAFSGLLELRGANLGGAGTKVRHAGVELTVVQRHPQVLLCALPAGGPAPKTGALELSGGTTLSGWTTLHPSLRLVPEAQLVPRAEVTYVGNGPLAADGRPYPRTRYTTELTFHEVPGDTVTEFHCKVFVPEIFETDYVVNREFGFNSFKVSIPEAELPGWENARFECKVITERAGVQDSTYRFYEVVATCAIAEQQVYKVESTWELRDVLAFEPDEVFGLTQGTSQGLAGSYAVGRIELEGDLAFRIASAPTGTRAAWVSSLVPLRNGWTVTRMTWKETEMHPPGLQPIARVLRKHDGNGFAFDLGHKYVGWTALTSSRLDESPLVRFSRYYVGENSPKTPNPSPYDTENRRYVRPLRVALVSLIAATNDNRVTAKLESVELRGPAGADWRDAFEPGVPVDKGRWLHQTMNPTTF